MIHVQVRQEVEDFDKWKAAFDAGSEMRAAAGSVKGHIFRDADNPSMVTLLVHFENAEKAQGYMKSPELAEAMKTAGVVGKPEVYTYGYEEKFVD